MKNKLMVQGQKAMMVHFTGTQKATDDAIKLVKTYLLIYDGESIGELQFGRTNSITPTLSTGGSPTLQKITPENNLDLSQRPDSPTHTAATGWRQSIVTTKNIVNPEVVNAVASKPKVDYLNVCITYTHV